MSEMIHTDKLDQTGMTCTGTNIRCQIDKLPSLAGMNIEQRQTFLQKVSKFNKSYTNTVKKLQANDQHASVMLPSLSGSGTAQATFTSSEVAAALIARTVVYSPSAGNAHTDTTTNTTYIPTSVLVGNAAPAFGSVGASERGSMIVLVHEGMHGTAKERDFVGRAGGTEKDMDRGGPLGAAHQEPYDDAAKTLYGPDP
jgi:hypothetical protein